MVVQQQQQTKVWQGIQSVFQWTQRSEGLSLKVKRKDRCIGIGVPIIEMFIWLLTEIEDKPYKNNSNRLE